MKNKFIPLIAVLISIICLSNIDILNNALASPNKPPTFLRRFMNSHHRYFGAAIQSQYIDYNKNKDDAIKYRQTLTHNFNSITPEYEMKWDQLEPQYNSYNYKPVDQMVEAANLYHQKIRGHTLVWYEQVPQWATDEFNNHKYIELLNHLYEYITNVVQHFAGKVYAWDVVNEVIDDNPNNNNIFHLRDSIFATASEYVYGNKEEFIKQAFKLTHKYDPKAKLYINDYRVEGTNPQDQGMQIKSDNYYNLVKDLQSKNIPISAVGFQTHIDSDGNILPANFKDTLDKFANLNLDVAITELTDNNLQTQADNYKNVVNDCLIIQRCVGVTVWGLTDLHVNAANTALFDQQYKRKASYNAITSLN